jgi:hypothetical protein
MQSRKRSVAESVLLTALGIGYAIPLNWYMNTQLIWSSHWAQAFWVTFWFTCISFALKYAVRRAFNYLDERYPEKPSQKLRLVA